MIESELLIEHLGEIKTHALKKIWLQRHCRKRRNIKTLQTGTDKTVAEDYGERNLLMASRWSSSKGIGHGRLK